MPEFLKISDISKMLSVQHDLNVTAVELNQMLILTGDLVQTAVNKVETPQGRKHGIYGEYRTPDGEGAYWLPLYNEEAVEYVTNMALSVFSSRLPQVAPPEAPVVETVTAPHVETIDCHACMLYLNEDCNWPKPGGCRFYRPAPRPTAQDIENMLNAHENALFNRTHTQNALGEPDGV